ncbi:MAG: carboxypeptidase regulatory-like domain-containing protein [Acidimicrobiales bacterium]
MRVELRTPFIETRPRDTSRITLVVNNTSDVIDDVVVRAVGLDATAVRSDPDHLPLFPGSEGSITLALTLPMGFPAGDHTIPLEVISSARPEESVRVDLKLDVAVDDDVSIAVRPQTLTAGSKGEFEVICTNRGNRPIDLTMLASDNEYALRHQFEPPFVTLPAGHEVVTILRVSGRRPLMGQNFTRRLTITALGPDRQLSTEATFSQRPRIRRAPVTFLILAGIIALWALLFTFAINSSLSEEALEKEFPPRAFEALALALGADEPIVGAAAARLDPTTSGGGVSGTVRAASTNEAVGRITVEAIRQTRLGPQLASAGATDDTGTFTLDGLVPGRYTFRFSSPGFDDVWYPAASSEAAAEVVQVVAGQTRDDLDVVVTGQAGAIVGSVDIGEAVDGVTVTVTAREIVDGAVGEIVAETTTDASNTYSLSPLATPGEYDLSFTAPGYEPATSRERIDGGEIGVANTVRLSAGPGSITGTVRANGVPLGGVQVRATSGDQQWATATPTSGVVGLFDLSELPTPGTYTLTFELDGYGSETIAIALGPGQSRTNLAVDMVGGTGTITGTVRSGGSGVGDVTVTVSGGPIATSTTTLTAGNVGSYRLTGLPTPARYTLTFSAPGFRPETVSVDLTSNQSASGIDVSLTRSIGSITGVVRDDITGNPISGVVIDVTDGSEQKAGLSASSPPGAFAISGLGGGAWSLTFTAPGYQPHTELVSLSPGQDAAITIRMRPS